MHWLLGAEHSGAELRAELARTFPEEPIEEVRPLILQTEAHLPGGGQWPRLAFTRQLLPDARTACADSVSGWAREVFAVLTESLPEDRPWRLHVVPHYGASTGRQLGARAWHSLKQHGLGQSARQPPRARDAQAPKAEAGRQRCALIEETLGSLLREKRRHLLKRLCREPAPFAPEDSLVQLVLTAPDAGCLSVVRAPVPYEQRHILSPFPKGEVPPASDPEAPSRAFAKLVEAELRLGRRIQTGETCVDLGAAPGSWTYVAVKRGAHVIAVDRSPLREDLMRSPQVRFEPGNAFQFRPARPIDWLVCDVIAPADQTTGLLVEWLKRSWCRHFVVTLKLRDAAAVEDLERVKREVPPLASEFFLTRLCANKREVCVFGTRRQGWESRG